MISINFKVIGFTRLGFENARYGFEPTTFGFPNVPGLEADALSHSATLTDHSNVYHMDRMCTIWVDQH